MILQPIPTQASCPKLLRGEWRRYPWCDVVTESAAGIIGYRRDKYDRFTLPEESVVTQYRHTSGRSRMAEKLVSMV